MNASEMYEKAKQRAAVYAPPPKYDPVQAGIAAAAIAGLLLGVLIWLVGIDVNAFGIPLFATVVIAFGVPWAILKRQSNKFTAATAKELRKLEAGARSEPP